jgi:hypothetical protein
MDTATLRNDSAPGREFAELTAQARAAYQEKRTKECLELTHRVLAADPGNSEANGLREAVLADIERDLQDARALLEDSLAVSDGQKYRKAAEIILLKILYIDATHAEAKELFAQAKGSSSSVPFTASPVQPTYTASSVQPIRRAHLEEAGFTASPTPVVLDEEPRQPINLRIPLICAGIIVLGSGLWFFGSKAVASFTQSSDAAVVAPVESKPPVPRPAQTSRPVVSTVSTAVTPANVPPKNEVQPAEPQVPVNRIAATVPAPTPAPPPVPAPTSNKPAAAKEPGSLAVNSPMAADIYLGDKYLGATPTTLSMPPGRHTIEYRSGDLRASMTHEVRSGETTTVFVTFEITVHLNARPWANVFVEGTSRKALGQTPLSSVRVPIGSVLTFENPQFPPKNYRVRPGDSAIQVVFP